MDLQFQQAHGSSHWSEPRVPQCRELPASDGALCDEGLYGMANFSPYDGIETHREQSSYLLTPPASVSGSYQPLREVPTFSTASSIYPFQRPATTSPPPTIFSPIFQETVTARPIETRQASQGEEASQGRPQGGSRYRAVHNLTIKVPEGPMAAYSSPSFGVPLATPTSEPSSTSSTSAPSQLEINQFLADMGEILGPKTMASLSPPLAHSYPPSPFSPDKTATSQFSGAGVYSGVYVNAEDMALFSRSPSPPPLQSTYQFPRSAPAYRTTFDESIFRPLASPSPFYPISSLPLHSPRSSNPPSPNLAFRHRRGSSLDAELRGSHSHAASYSYPSHLVSPAIQPRASPYNTLRRPMAPPRRTMAPPKGGFSFINYGVGDASALLNGVAPSGSSKRKREEAEEAERERERARQRV